MHCFVPERGNKPIQIVGLNVTEKELSGVRRLRESSCCNVGSVSKIGEICFEVQRQQRGAVTGTATVVCSMVPPYY